MVLSVAAWQQAKADALAAARADARAVAGGLPPGLADQLVAAIRAPLVAALDGRDAHFLADDAAAVAGVAGVDESGPVDGRPHAVVDRRDWNAVLGRLAAAGHAVVCLDLD